MLAFLRVSICLYIHAAKTYQYNINIFILLQGGKIVDSITVIKHKHGFDSWQ